MHPYLVNLGFFQLNTYGACMAVGFLLCWTLVERISGRKDLSNLLMSLMLGGVAGSRIAYVVEHWRAEFAAHPLDVLRIDRGGLMFYGGLVLSLVVFLGWCIAKREHPLKLADLFCTFVPLGHACGRIGCFFYGCCYGKLSDSVFAVRFPFRSPAWYEQFHAGLIDANAPASLPVLPTQLFEAAALLVLFAALLALYLRFRRGTAGAYFIGYAVIRFFLEYLRGDPRAVVLGLSISQAISLGMLLVGCAFLYLAFRKPAGGSRT